MQQVYVRKAPRKNVPKVQDPDFSIPGISPILHPEDFCDLCRPSSKAYQTLLGWANQGREENQLYVKISIQVNSGEREVEAFLRKQKAVFIFFHCK